MNGRIQRLLATFVKREAGYLRNPTAEVGRSGAVDSFSVSPRTNRCRSSGRGCPYLPGVDVLVREVAVSRQVTRVRPP